MFHYQLVKFPDHVRIVEIVDFEGMGKGYTVLEDMVGEDRKDLLHMLHMMVEDIVEYGVMDWKDLPK